MRTPRPYKLDLRKLWRRLGREEQLARVEQLKRAGGSIAREAARASLVKVRRYGYVIAWHLLGQKFLWYTRGTKAQGTGDPGQRKFPGQPARPSESSTPVEKVKKELRAELARQFGAWDRSA